MGLTRDNLYLLFNPARSKRNILVKVSKKPHKQRLFILLSYTHSHHVYLNISYTGTGRTTWPRYLTIREIHFANSWKIEFCSARRTNLDKLFLRVAAIKLNLQDDEVQPTFYSIFLIILVIIALHWSISIVVFCNGHLVTKITGRVKDGLYLSNILHRRIFRPKFLHHKST